MKRSPRALKIVEARHANGHCLRIVFSDGTEQTVDFGPFLRGAIHPEIRKFLIPKNFKKFAVRDGDLMWGDFDLVFPIMDLYENSLIHDDVVDSKPRSSSGAR
jgi:hypothetical protein